MNIAVNIEAATPAGVSVIRDVRGLESFRDTACAAAIWQRQIPPDVLAWLSDLHPKRLPSGRVVLQPNAVGATVGYLCDIAKMPEKAERDWLTQDITSRAENFAVLMKTPYLRLRLQAVTSNACRRFHRDTIMGRLVCTYRRQGTQYGTSAQGEDPAKVFTTPTGAPIPLRGSLWPPKPDVGLLHRSPPIEGTGETRLVLVLDPIFDLDEAE